MWSEHEVQSLEHSLTDLTGEIFFENSYYLLVEVVELVDVVPSKR